MAWIAFVTSSKAMTLTPEQRREILDLLHDLAGYALEGWEEAEEASPGLIPEVHNYRKRLDAAIDLLSK